MVPQYMVEAFSDDVVAAAMIDRLVHHAEVLTLTGFRWQPPKTQRSWPPEDGPATTSCLRITAWRWQHPEVAVSDTAGRFRPASVLAILDRWHATCGPVRHRAHTEPEHEHCVLGPDQEGDD